MYPHFSYIMSVMLIHLIKKHGQLKQYQNVHICAVFLVYLQHPSAL